MLFSRFSTRKFTHSIFKSNISNSRQLIRNDVQFYQKRCRCLHVTSKGKGIDSRASENEDKINIPTESKEELYRFVRCCRELFPPLIKTPSNEENGTNKLGENVSDKVNVVTQTDVKDAIDELFFGMVPTEKITISLKRRELNESTKLIKDPLMRSSISSPSTINESVVDDVEQHDTKATEETLKQTTDETLIKHCIKNFDRDETKIKVYDFVDADGDEYIRAFVLPKDVSMWPTFMCTKQDDAEGSHVYLLRMDEFNLDRINETLKRIRLGKKVIWLGNAGTSKSTDLNTLILLYLGNMGREGWPTEVHYRISDKIIYFSWDKSTENVIVKEVPCSNLDELRIQYNKYTYTASTSRPVLLIELEENEVDPRAFANIVVSASARDADVVLKTLVKSRSEILINQPWSKEQSVCAGLALFLFSPEKARFLDASSIEEVYEKMMTRFFKVGGLTRYLLAEESDYVGYKDVLNKVEGISIEDLYGLSIFNLPRGFKYIIGLFLSTAPSGSPFPKSSAKHSYFGYLNDAAAIRAARLINDDKVLEGLTRKLSFFTIQEMMMIVCITSDNARGRIFGNEILPDCWKLNSWEWHKTSKLNEQLSRRTMISGDDIPIPKIGWITMIEDHRGVMQHENVSNLRNNVLYKSRSHNKHLIEFLTVDVNEKTKSVNLFQSTMKTLKDHAFNISTVKKVLENLHLIGQNEDYIINLICLIPCIRESDVGVAFYENNESNESNGLTERDVNEKLNLGGRFRAYAVRAHVLNFQQKFSYSGKSPVLNKLKFTRKEDEILIKIMSQYDDLKQKPWKKVIEPEWLKAVTMAKKSSDPSSEVNMRSKEQLIQRWKQIK